MTSEMQLNVCLDVAVDHRIKKLFKPVLEEYMGHSKHVSRIEQRGRALKRSHEEIQITAELAGPEVKGGIAIALQQPRHNHPFKDGIDQVIEDCKTLHALDEVFATVSCGTLDIQTDISVFDLLPYMSDEVADIDNAELTESFRVAVRAICGKEPKVLLCAGKIRLPEWDRSNNIKKDARKLESVGIGRTFGSTPKLPVMAKIRHIDGKLVSIRRVNGFHPSYAMNYHAHSSRLRQLQIMIGAEACGLLRGDWEDKEWMVELRHRCQELSESHGTSSPKYLPQYEELYLQTLICLQNSANIVLDRNSAQMATGTIYETLLSSNLSEACNDASLIMRQMSRLQLQYEDWPDSVAWKNVAALENAAMETLKTMRNLLGAMEQGYDLKLAGIVQRGANSILQCVSPEGNELNLSEASYAFLNLATDIETLLSDLLLEKEETPDGLGQEGVLSSMLGNMNLTSHT